MTALILSHLWPYIAGAVAALALFLTGRATGGAKARQRQAEAQAKAKAFRETTKDVTHETLSSDPVDAIRDRLRERGRKP